MANTNAPFGFRQRAGLGSAPTYELAFGNVAYNTNNIFQGDPIFRLSDGTLAGVTAGPGPGTAILAGVFDTCNWISTSQKRRVWSNYWPGSDLVSGQFASTHYINDPNAQFLAQMGGSSSVGFVAADVGLNCQFAYGTGNTANGLSGAYVDETVPRATTNTLPFRVMSLVTSPPGANGTNAGAYNYAVVAFNNVETKSLTAQN